MNINEYSKSVVEINEPSLFEQPCFGHISWKPPVIPKPSCSKTYPPFYPPFSPFKRPVTLVDDTLSFAGEAADAKVTGDLLRQKAEQITAIESSLFQINTEITTINHSIEELQNSQLELEEKVQRVMALESRVISLEVSRDEILRRLLLIDTYLSVLDERLSTNEEATGENTTQISQHERTLENLQERVSTLESSLGEMGAEIQSLKTTTQGLQHLEQDAIFTVKVDGSSLQKTNNTINIPISEIISAATIDGGDLEESE